MDLIRFTVISLGTEIIFMPILSFLILKRKFFPQYFLALIFTIFGVLINELMIIKNKDLKYGHF